jgi:hypothetical protein
MSKMSGPCPERRAGRSVATQLGIEINLKTTLMFGYTLLKAAISASAVATLVGLQAHQLTVPEAAALASGLASAEGPEPTRGTAARVAEATTAVSDRSPTFGRMEKGMAFLPFFERSGWG